MDKLVCSLCGWTSEQKKFRYKDINEHFENAYQIRCPRNCCKEEYDRFVPKGYIRNVWYEYCQWETIEEKPKIVSIEDVKAIHNAKRLRDIGLEI